MSLPRFIVIQPTTEMSYVYRKDDGSVCNGEETVFSPLVKIEAERAENNDRYIHLRFGHSNKYWQKNAADNSIVAVSEKPEEDTTKASCTLFEANIGEKSVSLTHVQTGWHVVQGKALAFEVENISTTYFVNYVDWDSIVKLPKHVAFMGDNGRYLTAFNYNAPFKIMQFGSDDPNDTWSGHEVSLMRDGHVRIKSDHFGRFWWWMPDWVTADSTDVTASDKYTLFWPIRVDKDTIALKNAGDGTFCQRLSKRGWIDCLSAGASSMAKETKLKVRELVGERKVYNVRYRMEHSRIFNETPYLAGTTSVTNNSDKESSMAVSITYQNQKSHSFTNSTSHTLGAALTFDIIKVPIIAGVNIEFSYEFNTAKEWNDTTTTITSVQATGTVPVPPKSIATVSYVGTMGTCDVPFSYTHQDRSSVDGEISESDQIDGVYTGINSYNFSFVIDETKPL